MNVDSVEVRPVEFEAERGHGPGLVTLPGDLAVPPAPAGLVLFAHGSGSSRTSPRNRLVASVLHEVSLATLLFDLLTQEESFDRGLVFDIPLLADRLLAATRWVRGQPEAEGLPVGYFGASTGAAAALWAAPEADPPVAAIVSRGGRPDLAGSRLPSVMAPTLLLVGELDRDVLDLNRQAQAMLGGPSELVVIPSAGHLFEEPGTLEMVARLAAGWFGTHLRAAG
jgi:putative phosphoribosyl transferase